MSTTGKRHRIFFRRLTLSVLTVLTTGIASFGAWRVVTTNGFHPLAWLIMPLFVLLTFPVALSFWTAMFGFFVLCRGRDPLALKRTRGGMSSAELSAFRTAIVVPAYNEDAVRLFAALKATYESVERTGHLPHFDFFLLSDTTNPDVWIREEMAFHDLRQEVGDPARLFYRNRHDNLEHKAGNIADFCATWSEQYRYMVVFDADSLMTGASLLQLVRLMEEHPAVGILQTPPVAVNCRSLFGRLLQFSARAYSPLFMAGLNYWQAGEANYWGHNAIIRVQPFVEHCRLPKLPGGGPLGGSILSHDFVEAALMRRAGWEIYLAGELGGSYEEIPPNLIGFAARDRRWCQGNLQHARLLTMPGLNWISRLHLALGIMSYASSPLWLLLLLLSTAAGLRTVFLRHAYFRPDQSPFPVWEVSRIGEAVILLASVLVMLLLPKLLSLVVWLTRKRAASAGFGGAWRLTASVLAETIFSVLLAPMLAVLHSRFVIATLLGRKVEWGAQDRGQVETRWREGVRWHLGITLLAMAWTALLWGGNPRLFWGLSPVLAGWWLSIPFSVWTSRVGPGLWARAHGLFLTPEEISPPLILQSFHRELEAAAARPWAQTRDGLAWILSDPHVCTVHLSLLPAAGPSLDSLAQNQLERLRLKAMASGIDGLLLHEKRELLWDSHSIQMLCSQAVVPAHH